MNVTSPARRRTVLAALRRGTVPESGLDLLAVGLDRFTSTFDEELANCAGGAAEFKAVRGEYGSGKTFLARWIAERAKSAGMAVAEVQISETETPLHRLETVYRRLCERLTMATAPPSAFRTVLDSWLYALEEDVLAEGMVDSRDPEVLGSAVEALLEQRLGEVARTTPGRILPTTEPTPGKLSAGPKLPPLFPLATGGPRLATKPGKPKRPPLTPAPVLKLPAEPINGNGTNGWLKAGRKTAPRTVPTFGPEGACTMAGPEPKPGNFNCELGK